MKTKNLTICAFSAAIIALCAWISIPMGIPFTLQTLAIFFICGAFGGKCGCISIAVYLLLGAIGFPIFSNFRGGLGTLFGTTGGYIFGFFISSLILWGTQRWWKNHALRYFVACCIALLACYLCGTLWFLFLSMQNAQPLTISAILMMCVIPFILPDLFKIWIAILLLRRFEIFQKKQQNKNIQKRTSF